MSSHIQIQKVCELCTSEFTARKTTTRFCSHKCASRAYKKRVREQKIEKTNTETVRIKTQDVECVKAKEFLTVSEVALLVGCSRRTAYRLVSKGVIGSVNLSERLTRIPRTEVDNFIQAIKSDNIIPKVKEYEISECYSMGEAQIKYNVSGKTLYDAIKRNNLPKIKHGRYVYVPKELLENIFT